MSINATSAELPSADDLFAEVARLDLKIDAQRQFSERSEASLAAGSLSDAERSAAILLIALRDDFIEEMQAHKALALKAMAMASRP